jgi:hypothetical protein
MGKNVFGMKRVDITAQSTHVPNLHPYNEPFYLGCFLLLSETQSIKDRRAMNYMVLFVYLFICVLFKESVRNPGCIASNYWMTENNKSEWVQKKEVLS